MDVSMLSAAAEALAVMLDPLRLAMLAAGVVIGLVIGVLPGIGGVTGLAILIPFTYGMDAYTAFAFLIGMAAVTATADTLPAVLFGVPGSAGSAATVLDGYPLARSGQAARALGAGYAASLMGGIFGAAVLAVSIPILRPVMLYLGSPELLSFCVFGLSMVAALSGRAPLKGLAAVGIGLMIAMMGAAAHSGTLRWTFGQLYLWEGLPLVPITLGLFALPELAEYAVSRRAMTADGSRASLSIRSQWQGFRDCIVHKWLLLRCSWLGASLGAVPGIGSAIIDWVAYGHAARSERNVENFGRGDIRGVIASESSNNAKEGGALVPTIAFGVPSGVSMTLLLGALLMHGLIPGPDMLGKNLNVTYSIVWSLSLANILGAGICFLFSGLLARILDVRFSILIAVTLAIVYVGAFEASRSWGDLYTMLLFGLIGWTMKQLGWPRPPLILGIVLGDIFERYLFISIERYDLDWLSRPVVVAMFAVSLIGLFRPLQRTLGPALRALLRGTGKVRLTPSTLWTVGLIALVAYALGLSWDWPRDAKIVPQTAAVVALVFLGLDLLVGLWAPAKPVSSSVAGVADIDGKIDPSMIPSGETVDPKTARWRAGQYFGSIVVFMGLAAAIGFLPGIAVFIALFMRYVGDDDWPTTLKVALGTSAFCWLVFDRFVNTAWPQSWLGDWVPWLRDVTGFL